MRIGAFKRLMAGLVEIESYVSAERGEFSLFALILDEDSPGLWHLFVAAPWIWEDRLSAREYLWEQVRLLEDQFMEFFGRLEIYAVEPDNPDLEEVWEYCNTENGMVEIYDVEILNVDVRRGYIFTSRRPAGLPQPGSQTKAEATA